MFVLYVIGSILFLGLCVMLISIRNAPQGFEDEKGFHEAPESKPAGEHGVVATRKAVNGKALAAVNVR